MKKHLSFLFALLLLCAAGCYDPDTPDTKWNKKAFRNMTGLVPDSGIKGIRAHEELFPPVDPIFCMAFTATPEAYHQYNFLQTYTHLMLLFLAPSSLGQATS